ncbi:hypothetical protein [uncultured Alistipes sp.]|uniref:hypothetical protein n=1 Tax=uncultured Alistipes sp. TaxID=538949 RepID=UPI002612C8DA|nr:hypothetical protein [uncultured Alistipes sp.]
MIRADLRHVKPEFIPIFGFALAAYARQNTSKLVFALAYAYLCYPIPDAGRKRAN